MPTLKEKLAAKKAEMANGNITPTLKEKLSTAKGTDKEYEGNWYDRPRAVLQGTTMGWSDELGAGAGALMAKGAQLFNDDETSLGNIYDQMKGNINRERKAYNKANPYESLALNLGGGLLTGGIGSGKLMATQAFKNSSNLAKTLKLMGLGSAEGAVAGAGSADEDNRLAGAGVGGTVGALLPAALAGGKKVLDVASNRRIQQSLTDEVGNFTPINQLTNEGSPLGNFYQKLVGNSMGGQELRDQNRTVLDKALAKLEASKSASEIGKTTGKKVGEQALRTDVKMSSLPTNVSPELLEKIKGADAHEASKLIGDAWKNGFDVIKNRSFEMNPKQVVDSIVSGMDSPMDAQYASQIKTMLEKKLKGGFTPDTSSPGVKYSSSGFGSKKNPTVELDSGTVDGKWLMQTRNDLRMRANELKDSGESAIEVNALKTAASKIDDLIRGKLDPKETEIFDNELSSWGNYQLGKKATGTAGKTKQGEYEPQDLLGAGKSNQPRNFDEGNAPFQTQAQQLQVDQKAKMDALNNTADLDAKALKEVQKKLPNLNPDFWSKGITTGLLGLPVAAIAPAAVPAFGYGVGKVASTKGAQKAVAGQTGTQEMLAKLLRQYEDSAAQQALQTGQGVLSREAIMNMTGE